jgi:hypothetical protein
MPELNKIQNDSVVALNSYLQAKSKPKAKDQQITQLELTVTDKGLKFSEIIPQKNQKIKKSTPLDVPKIVAFCSKNKILHPEFAENIVKEHMAKKLDLKPTVRNSMLQYITESQIQQSKTLFKDGKLGELYQYLSKLPEAQRSQILKTTNAESELNKAVTGNDLQKAYNIARLFSLIPQEAANMLLAETLPANPTRDPGSSRDLVLLCGLYNTLALASTRLLSLMRDATPKKFLEYFNIIGKYDTNVRDDIIKECPEQYLKAILTQKQDIDAAFATKVRIDGKNLLQFFIEQFPNTPALPLMFVAKLDSQTLEKLYYDCAPQLSKIKFSSDIKASIRGSLQLSMQNRFKEIYNSMASLVPNFKGKFFNTYIEQIAKWDLSDKMSPDMLLKQFTGDLAVEFYTETLNRYNQNSAVIRQVFKENISNQKSPETIRDLFIEMEHSHGMEALKMQTSDADNKKPLSISASLSLAKVLSSEIAKGEKTNRQVLGNMYKNLFSRVFNSLDADKKMPNNEKIANAGKFLRTFTKELRHEFFPKLDPKVRGMMNKLAKLMPPAKPAPPIQKK